MKNRKDFPQSKDMENVNRHFSSLAMNHFEQGVEILKEYGLTEHEIKRSINVIEKQFDKVDKEYRKLITDKGGKLFVEDYESVLNQFDKILGFDEN